MISRDDFFLTVLTYVQVDSASDGAKGAKFPEAEMLHRWRVPSPFLLQWRQQQGHQVVHIYMQKCTCAYYNYEDQVFLPLLHNEPTTYCTFQVAHRCGC